MKNTIALATAVLMASTISASAGHLQVADKGREKAAASDAAAAGWNALSSRNATARERANKVEE